MQHTIVIILHFDIIFMTTTNQIDYQVLKKRHIVFFEGKLCRLNDLKYSVRKVTLLVYCTALYSVHIALHGIILQM